MKIILQQELLIKNIKDFIVLQEYGEVIVEEINYKRYKSDINSEKRQYKNTNNVIEYVYILKRKTL